MRTAAAPRRLAILNTSAGSVKPVPRNFRLRLARVYSPGVRCSELLTRDRLCPRVPLRARVREYGGVYGPVRNRAAGAALRRQAPPLRQRPLSERCQPARSGLCLCAALAARACRDPLG